MKAKPKARPGEKFLEPQHRRFGKRLYDNAGVFPPSYVKWFDNKYGEKWYLRYEKLRNIIIKGKVYSVAYRIWSGGTK